MKDRFISLFGALVALYVVIVVFFNPQISDLVEHSVPTSIDKGENGLMGIASWLEQSKVPVYRLRHRYSDLGGIESLNKHGNLMIISLPQKFPAHDKEIDKLQKWVKQGNNLLILAAHGSPDVSNVRSFSARNNFLKRFGFRFQKINREDADSDENKKKKLSLSEMSDSLNKEISIELARRSSHPLMAYIRKVQGRGSKLNLAKYTLVSTSPSRSTLALLEEKSTSEPAFWETRFEGSRTWVTKYAYLFSNSQLAKADNARLLTNIIDASLARGGRVVFDDMHQGNTELYNQDAFFTDSRLHTTLWFVFAFWVLYIVGHTNRIAPLALPVLPARASEYIYAMAGLFARRLTKNSAAKLLFSHFFDWIRLKYGMPTNGKPVWQLLENTERISKTDLSEIKNRYEDLKNNKKVNLTKLVNKMQKMRSVLS